jgi:hypothetical protein
MATKNDVTGDAIQTKMTSDLYRQNWEKIFGKKKNKKNGQRRSSKKVQPTG